MKLSTRRSLSSQRNSRRTFPKEANLSTKYLLGPNRPQRNASENKLAETEIEINSDFYSKYEILMIYGPIVSGLKLPKVNFAFRPKVWQKAKLLAACEEILQFRADLQKRSFTRKLDTKVPYLASNQIEDIINQFLSFKFQASYMSGERYILELLWSIENHKKQDRYLNLVSGILRGNLDLDEVLFFLMCRE